MGRGLVSVLDYNTWKPRRQLYDPAFKKRFIYLQMTYIRSYDDSNNNIFFLISNLKTLLDPFNELASRFIEELRPKANGVETVPMKIKFGEFTLNVISKVGFHCSPRILLQYVKW